MSKTRKSGDITRDVTLTGIAELMFDRYAGDNKTQLRPDQKLYFAPGTQQLVMPARNLMSFLTAENTMSAPKRLLDSRHYKNICQAFKSFVRISPVHIPITRNGQPILFSGLADDRDAQAGIYLDHGVARLPKGIPNPKVRPVLELPWELSFKLMMMDNDETSEEQLQNIFIRGGLAVGLGTFRGMYGLFEVSAWR